MLVPKLHTIHSLNRSAVKMAIGRLCFYSRYFWPSILFLLLNVTSPGNEEKGKTILHRPMSFGFWFATYHRIYGSYSLTDMFVKSAILDCPFVGEAS